MTIIWHLENEQILDWDVEYLLTCPIVLQISLKSVKKYNYRI